MAPSLRASLLASVLVVLTVAACAPKQAVDRQSPSPAAISASPAFEAPKVRVDYKPTSSIDRYTVGGATSDQIYSDMVRKGPGPWAGEAEWQTGYDTYGEYGDDGLCHLERVIVSVDVTLTLPEWNAPSGASAATRAYWKRTLSLLERHERGHQRIVEAYGRKLVNDLKRIDTAISCGQLYDRGDRAADRIFDDTNRDNRAYDARTSHGLNQSAA